MRRGETRRESKKRKVKERTPSLTEERLDLETEKQAKTTRVSKSTAGTRELGVARVAR